MEFVNLTGKKYKCPKHGFQGGVIGVEVSVKHNHDAPNQAYADGIHTRICMQCFVEMLNSHCKQLIEINEEEAQ